MNRMIRSGALAALIAATALLVAAPLALAHPGHSHEGPKKGKHKKHKKSQKGSRAKALRSTQKPQKVAIEFAALNGGKPVSCSKPIANLGTSSRTARLTDLRFYVSEVQLLRKGGGVVDVELPANSEWSYAKGVAAVTLIDLENGTGSCAAEGTKAMNTAVRGTVPKASYSGIRYSLSVPDSLSHTDLTAMPAPLNNTAMGWSWQFGRKFAKIEVSESPGGPAWGSKTFFVHLGSTDCKGDPAAGEKARCSLPNRNQVTLAKFNPARQRIAIDLKTLLGSVDVAGTGGMGSMAGASADDGMGMPMGGCMSGTTEPDCKPIFKTLGLKLGTNKKTAQTAFRVIGK